MKGTFNQGWWNCFESFASALLSADKYADCFCMGMLEDAGITKREASAFIKKEEYHDPKVIEVVRNYLLKLQ